MNPLPQGIDQSTMAFLAGAGLPVLLESLARIMPKQQGAGPRNPMAPSAQLPHRPGMRIEATPGGGPPQTTIAPSMLQALMSQLGQGQQQPQPEPPGAPGGMPPQALLQMLAQRGV